MHILYRHGSSVSSARGEGVESEPAAEERDVGPPVCLLQGGTAEGAALQLFSEHPQWEQSHLATVLAVLYNRGTDDTVHRA